MKIKRKLLAGHAYVNNPSVDSILHWAQLACLYPCWPHSPTSFVGPSIPSHSFCWQHRQWEFWWLKDHCVVKNADNRQMCPGPLWLPGSDWPETVQNRLWNSALALASMNVYVTEGLSCLEDNLFWSSTETPERLEWQLLSASESEMANVWTFGIRLLLAPGLHSQLLSPV